MTNDEHAPKADSDHITQYELGYNAGYQAGRRTGRWKGNGNNNVKHVNTAQDNVEVAIQAIATSLADIINHLAVIAKVMEAHARTNHLE